MSADRGRGYTRRKLLIGAGTLGAVSAGAMIATTSQSTPVTYKYDQLGRVILVTRPDGSQTSYSYDAADNRTQRTTSGAPVTIIPVTAASNLRTLADNAGYTGIGGVIYQFLVGSAVSITGAAGGGAAIDTGFWPSDAQLSLIISGNIYGGGGTGGAGSNSSSGSNGGAGGDALICNAAIAVTVNSGASIKGGGGGGGGGSFAAGTKTVGGDGGGGGFPNGYGGAGSSGTSGDPAITGATGTVSGGGAGATGGPPGGNGGNAGSAGSAGTTGSASGGGGGGAGYAIRKNGKTVTVTNNGTITGTVS